MKFFKSEEWEDSYRSQSSELKRIANYTRMSFEEVLNLSYPEYLLYKRDSWIESFMNFEKGREFLQTLWRLNQTDADIKAIRNFEERGR